MIIDLNRFQRAQSEILYEFIRYLQEAEVITDDTILTYLPEFGAKYELNDEAVLDLADYFTTSARDLIGDDESLLPYLVFKESHEQEQMERFFEQELVREEIREMNADHAFANLPPHIRNLLETHETLDDVANSLNALTPDSSLGEIGIGFGFSSAEEFIEVIKRDLQINEEMAEKAKDLTVDTSFTAYVELVGGTNPLVALDAMRMDIVRTINSLTS